jgi:hypothetical protein
MLVLYGEDVQHLVDDEALDTYILGCSDFDFFHIFEV